MAGVENWTSHFGIAHPPFAKSIPASKLFERTAHKEAVARIRYCVSEMAMGAITGDVGAGKSVALRAATAAHAAAIA